MLARKPSAIIGAVVASNAYVLMRASGRRPTSRASPAVWKLEIATTAEPDGDHPMEEHGDAKDDQHAALAANLAVVCNCSAFGVALKHAWIRLSAEPGANSLNHGVTTPAEDLAAVLTAGMVRLIILSPVRVSALTLDVTTSAVVNIRELANLNDVQAPTEPPAAANPVRVSDAPAALDDHHDVEEPRAARDLDESDHESGDDAELEAQQLHDMAVAYTGSQQAQLRKLNSKTWSTILVQANTDDTQTCQGVCNICQILTKEPKRYRGSSANIVRRSLKRHAVQSHGKQLPRVLIRKLGLSAAASDSSASDCEDTVDSDLRTTIQQLTARLEALAARVLVLEQALAAVTNV